MENQDVCTHIQCLLNSKSNEMITVKKITLSAFLFQRIIVSNRVKGSGSFFMPVYIPRLCLLFLKVQAWGYLETASLDLVLDHIHYSIPRAILSNSSKSYSLCIKPLLPLSFICLVEQMAPRRSSML